MAKIFVVVSQDNELIGAIPEISSLNKKAAETIQQEHEGSQLLEIEPGENASKVMVMLGKISDSLEEGGDVLIGGIEEIAEACFEASLLIK